MQENGAMQQNLCESFFYWGKGNGKGGGKMGDRSSRTGGAEEKGEIEKERERDGRCARLHLIYILQTQPCF